MSAVDALPRVDQVELCGHLSDEEREHEMVRRSLGMKEYHSYSALR